MRRSEVIGLPVLSTAGERLGDVADLLVSAPDGRVIGFLLAGGGTLSGHRVYPFEEVRAIGDGAVLVDEPRAVLTTRRARRLRELLARHNELVGKRLISQGGDDLGVIDDLVFDPVSGAIAGYQVSGGVVRDLLEGKDYIPVAAGLIIGKDAVICPDHEQERRA